MVKRGVQAISYRDTCVVVKRDMFGFLQRAADMRLDGVDLHYAHFEATDDAYLERIKLFCLRAGLHLSYIGVSNDFGKTGEELERQKSLVKHWVDVAERMGIPMVRNFGAWLPEGEAEEEVWSRLIAAQKEVTAYARSKGVVIGLHNHNHVCVPATGAPTLSLLEAADDAYDTHLLALAP